MTLEERSAAARVFKPELCSMNMGSMNFGLFPMLDRVSEFKHRWEREYLEGSRDFIFRNTYKDIERLVTELGDERHQVRVRVLRRRSPLQPRALRRPWTGEAAAVRPDDLRDPRRDRAGAREPDAHEDDRRSPVRRRLLLVGARRRSPPDLTGDDVRDHGRQRPRRARGQHLSRQGRAGRSPTRTRSRRSAGSSASCRSRSPRPSEAREMLGLKGAAETAIPELSARKRGLVDSQPTTSHGTLLTTAGRAGGVALWRAAGPAESGGVAAVIPRRTRPPGRRAEASAPRPAR